MQSTYRKPSMFLAALFGTTLLFAGPAPADAATQASHNSSSQSAAAANPCKRQNYRKVVFTFYRGPQKVLLRCGTKSWGYNHIAAHGRWNQSFKNKIADTLWKGYQTSPGVIYRYKPSNTCKPKPVKNFKVVMNSGPYGGGGNVSPQGIITATYEYTSFAPSTTRTVKC
ncbi:hypothetical protein AB0M87_08740 [Streptomyces sp. NPDC051320]|uniref:hypothetical protein n=1 Tax=Streptomyces sp. NPDC051320 TaxID=3154644 RepID=UPI0034171E75